MHLLVSLFGFVSVIRILVSFHEKNLFLENTLTKIGTLYFLASITISFACSFSVFVQVLLHGMLLFGILYFPLFMVFTGERSLQKQIPEKVKMMSLFMKLGQSFRASFQSVIEAETSPKVKTQLTKMYRIVTFPQQNQALFYLSDLNKLTSDLRFVDELEFGAAQSLEHIGNYQQVLSDFRRKSGKVRAQIQLQAWILSFLILAVYGFMGWSFGFRESAPFLIVSLVLAGAGHFMSLYLGRRIKWRI